MKKRIFASLLALVMAFSLLPVSAMAASSTDLDAEVPELAKLGDTYIQRRTPQQNEQGGVKNSTINVPVQNYSLVTNEPGTYQRLPMAGNNYAIYTPTNYAVPATANVTVSEEGIIGNCSFTLGRKLYNGRYYPCLQFDYKALQEGTVTVTLHYYYNYALLNTENGTVWWKEDATFTVTVGEQVKPTGKPVVSNFTDEISLKCIDNSAHDASADFDDSSVTGGYSFGDIINNDGANALFPIDEFPWMCVMTFNTRAYLDAYNSVLSSRYDTHYLAENQDAEKTFTFYSRGNKKWSYDSKALPVVINITHVEPTPKPDVPDTPNGNQIIEDLGDAVKDAVKVECVNETGAHSAKTYDLTAGDIGSITMPTKNSAGKYTVNVTIEADEYVKQYSTYTGVSHNLKTGAASSQTIALTYNAANNKWEATGTAPYVTFEVEHEETPAKPNVNEIYKGGYSDLDGNPYVGEGGSKEFAVILECNKDTKHIYGFNSLGLVDGGYTLGNVEPNTGANKTDYPYTCTMTVDYTKYMEQANKDIQEKHPADGEHEIVGTETTREIVWYYNRASKSWSVLAENDRAPIVIPVTCEKAPDEDMLETAVENAVLYVDCETVNSHGQQAIALDGYDKTTVTTRPYTVARAGDKTATVTITDQQAYADQYKPDGAAHTYDSENRSNRNTFTMEWKKGADGWNWYLKGEPALIMTKCTPKPTDDDVKKALDGLEKGVQVTCVTEKNNHGSETYAVKLGLPKNWELGGETNWNGHIGYEVEAPTSSFVNLFSSEHGKHTVKDGMPKTLRWVIYWDGSSWKADPNDNPPAIEVEHVNAPDTYQVTVKNSAATNSGAGFYEADKTVTIHAGSRNNYSFDGWTSDSADVTLANANKASTTFTMPNHAVTVTASWTYTDSSHDDDDDEDTYYFAVKKVDAQDGHALNGAKFKLYLDGKQVATATSNRSGIAMFRVNESDYRKINAKSNLYYQELTAPEGYVVNSDEVSIKKSNLTTSWSRAEKDAETVRNYRGTTPDLLNGDDHFAYVVGYQDGCVHPNALITRAETAAIFFRLLKDDVRDDNLRTSNTFADVPNDYWANTAISTMAGLGIVQGYNSTAFDPNASITRAEFAAICARFDTGKSSGTQTFTDIKGHWAEKYIERAAELGWIKGLEDGTFRPNDCITRAQAMTMINRVLNRIPEDASDLLPDMNVWPDCNPGDWFYLAVQEATNSHDFKHKAGNYETWTSMSKNPDWTRYEN